jgi:hypothetical protein
MSSGDACLDGVSVTENITKVRHTMFSTHPLMTLLHLLSVLNIVCLSLVIFFVTLTPSR